MKMNCSTKKVQISYSVELLQSNFPAYTISRLWAFSQTLAEFPYISRKVVMPYSSENVVININDLILPASLSILLLLKI